MITLLSILFSLLESVPLLLRHRLQKKMVVPSLWYFRALQSKKTTDEEGGRNISLKNWLSILLLFLIAGAIINFIGFQQSFQRSVYIIDASASMQVLEDEERRLDKALAAAKRQIRTDKPNELMIISAGLKPNVISPFSANPSTWTERLDQIIPVDCASDLKGAILAAQAALGKSGGDIYCFTDAHLELPEDQALSEQFHWVKIPDKTRNNVGIINLNDNKPISSKAPFFVDTKNYSLRPLSFDLLVKNEQKAELHRENIELQPLEKHRVFIKPGQLKLDLKQEALISIEVDIQDVFALDNIAYGQLSTVDLPNVYLVSTQSTFKPIISVFAEFYQYDFYQIDQGKFYALDISPQDIFVFDNFIPESPERYKGLLLQPAADFQALSQKYQLQAPSIHHPILAEVSWELFDEAIFSDTESSLASSKQQGFYQLARLPEQAEDNQWLVLNRDIFQLPESERYHQEKEQVAYKLLFNSLAHLSFAPQEEAASNIFKCGTMIKLPRVLNQGQNEALKVTLPNGRKQEMPKGDRFFLGEQTGVYQIEGKESWSFALNLLDDRISSLEGEIITGLPDANLAELVIQDNRSVKQTRPRAGLLLLIIILLGVDWFYFYYRFKTDKK